MKIPTPVYERIPQFYVLFGLLFVTNGLYMGFEFMLSFYYIFFGLLASVAGIALFVIRIKQSKDHPAAAAPEPMQADHTLQPTQ